MDAQKILREILGGDDDKYRYRDRGYYKDRDDDRDYYKKNKSSYSSGVKGGVLGSLAGLLLGSKRSSSSMGGSALKAGGLTVLAGLAYKAWQNYQAQQAGQAPPPQQSPGDMAAKAEGTGFLPKSQAERDDLTLTLVSAMIAAAKADGHIDADEQKRIFARIDEGNLSSEEKGFLMDQIRHPLDIDALAAKATTMERAAEIYAASVLAINTDNPAEADYLERLAQRLRLVGELKKNIETEVNSAALPT